MIGRLDAVKRFGERGEMLINGEMPQKDFAERFNLVVIQAREQGVADLLWRTLIDKKAIAWRKHLGNRAPARGEDGQAKGESLNQIHRLVFVLVISGKAEKIGVQQRRQFFPAADKANIFHLIAALGRGQNPVKLGLFFVRYEIAGDRQS